METNKLVITKLNKICNTKLGNFIFKMETMKRKRKKIFPLKVYHIYYIFGKLENSECCSIHICVSVPNRIQTNALVNAQKIPSWAPLLLQQKNAYH